MSVRQGLQIEEGVSGYTRVKNHKIYCEVTTRLWYIKIQTEVNISFLRNLSCVRKAGTSSLGIHLWICLHYSSLLYFLFNRLQRLLTPCSKMCHYRGIQPFMSLVLVIASMLLPQQSETQCTVLYQSLNQWFCSKVDWKFSQERSYPTRLLTWRTWTSCRLVVPSLVKQFVGLQPVLL